jgi:hypothetical protein
MLSSSNDLWRLYRGFKDDRRDQRCFGQIDLRPTDTGCTNETRTIAARRQDDGHRWHSKPVSRSPAPSCSAWAPSRKRPATGRSQRESDASRTVRTDRRISGLVMGSQVPTRRTGRASPDHLPQVAPSAPIAPRPLSVRESTRGTRDWTGEPHCQAETSSHHQSLKFSKAHAWPAGGWTAAAPRWRNGMSMANQYGCRVASPCSWYAEQLL